MVVVDHRQEVAAVEEVPSVEEVVVAAVHRRVVEEEAEVAAVAAALILRLSALFVMSCHARRRRTAQAPRPTAEKAIACQPSQPSTSIGDYYSST